jgi:hypothetical protein
VRDAHIVAMAIRYLDHEIDDPGWSLMGLMEYIDAYEKTIISAEDVNEALRLRPEISIVRSDRGILFCSDSEERSVTDAELAETTMHTRKTSRCASNNWRSERRSRYDTGPLTISAGTSPPQYSSAHYVNTLRLL